MEGRGGKGGRTEWHGRCWSSFLAAAAAVAAAAEADGRSNVT